MGSIPAFFETHESVAPIGLLAMDGAKEMGRKINNYLVSWHENSQETYMMDSACPRFSSGDSKGLIRSTVRGKDLFFLVDIGNYNCTYEIFGEVNRMSPDDHLQDLKRLIQATSGKGYRISVIMPLLYGGRQHRRNYRESLDCACMLQELQNMGVANIITFDAHDARVQNAIPLMGFDNIMPYYQVLKCMIKHFHNVKFDKDTFMVVSPDEGAMTRNMFYASALGVQLGMFYKRRDYTQVVNGRNPILAHEYLGTDVAGKDMFITDDVISSGDSMLDLVYALKEKGARRIFCNATYAIFTNGLERFDKAYEENKLDCVFGTNLTYCSPELLQRKWFYLVDVSKYIAYIIAALNRDMSINEAVDPLKKIQSLLEERNRVAE